MASETLNDSPVGCDALSTQLLPGHDSTDASRKVIIQGRQCLCGEEIKAEDLVLADMSNTRVSTGGGLYLVEMGTKGKDEWRGCRRMMATGYGVQIDLDGCRDWKTFPTVEAAGLRVVGVVLTVFRPTRYQ